MTILDHGLQLPALPEERNRILLASVGGVLVPRMFASVSAFDSAVQVRGGAPSPGDLLRFS
jgi:hypothetical protein